MGKFQNIVEGYGNLISSNPEIEKLAHERMKICDGCDENWNLWCKKCNCYIPAKARSRVEVCSLDLW